MNKIKFIPILFGLAMLFICCGKLIPSNSKRIAKDIKVLHYQILPSKIDYFSNGSKAEFNPIFSDSSTSLNEKVLQSILSKQVNVESIPFGNNEPKRLIESLYKLYEIVERNHGIKNVKLPEEFLDFYKKKKVDFALINFSTGFTRSKLNYAEQLAMLAVGSAVLPNGTFNQGATKANLSNTIIILDIQNNKIAFFRRKNTLKEPLNERNITKNISVILSKFFEI